jgi:hypothetical protein
LGWPWARPRADPSQCDVQPPIHPAQSSTPKAVRGTRAMK